MTSLHQWSSLAVGKQYWDKQGQRFTHSFFGSPSTQFYLEDEKRIFRDYLGNLKGKKLLKLDLWNEAQNTEILFWAANEGAECYGVDIAETTAFKAVKRSQSLGIPIRVALTDIVALPFPSNTFDCIYTMGTVEHLLEPRLAFAEIARVLKPGAVAIIGVPNKFDPFLFSLASDFFQRCGCYPYGLERWYTNRELGRQLEEYGISVVNRDSILFLPWFLRVADLYLWLTFPKMCHLTNLLIKPFYLLSRIRWMVRKFGYLTLCVVEK